METSMDVDKAAGTSKSAETQGSSQRKDAETREWAVVCAASTFDFGTGEIDPHKAAILFRSRHGGGVHKRVKERHSVFIERHYKNFREFGCIADAHRSGRPVIISEEDALAASKILKAGHWVTEKIKGLPGATYEELIYFSTMDEALLKSPQLQAIQQKYGVSPSKLLKRMHAVDPDLIRITLRSHHKFSYAELQDRIRWCLTMLARVAADPSMMYHIVFCDESTFVLHGLSKHSVQVYCSAGAARPSDVCFISDKTIKPIKVHFFLAVTAHGQYEDANGVVLYEECSGTTDIDRRANKLQDGSEMTGKQEYWTKENELAKSTTEEEMEALLHIVCTKFQKKTGHWPYLSIDNASIQAHIDVTCLKREGQPNISMPAHHNLKIPNYSPDINRGIEHQFGGGKPRVRNECYSLNHQVITGAELRKIVRRQFTTGVPKYSVAKDVAGLTLLWQIISSPAGQQWTDQESGRVCVGSGGNWGPRGSM